MHNAKKVFLNTAISYTRMMLTMGISLYSTRIVLNSLGAIDFGIFNLVAGVIAMLSFLNVAMAASTQRYMSFYQGSDNLAMQERIFGNSLFLHIVIGCILVIGLELSGLFLFNGFLNIPSDRIDVAKMIFHYMSGTVLMTVLSVPFTALLNAHENMLVIAFVNIIESLMKLAIALLLTNLIGQKLLIYGVLTASISILTLLIYGTYCLRKYEECTLRSLFCLDKKQLKELTSFAGWNLFGTLCGLGKTHGIAILLNVFLGSTVNAAYGIAMQVVSQLTFFSMTLLQVISPQIIKSEGANNREKMLDLSMVASKFGFFLVAILGIPFIFEMPTILKLWLKNVPNYTVIFCSLIIVATMVNQLTIGLQTALQATGKIKVYQVVVGSIQLVNIPVAYLVLKWGYDVSNVLFSFILIEFVACTTRLIFLNRITGFPYLDYFNKVLRFEFIPVAVSFIACFVITTYIESDLRLIYTFLSSGILFVGAVFYLGLSDSEYATFKRMINTFKNKKASSELNVYGEQSNQ